MPMEYGSNGGLNKDFFKQRPRGAPSILKPRRRRFPSGYHASAVHFDGNANLSIASLLATDNAFFSFSGWFKKATVDNYVFPWVTDPEGGYNNVLGIRQATSNGIKASFTSADQNSQLALNTLEVSEDWCNIIGSVDCNHAAGSRLGKLYLNDTDVTNFLNDLGIAFTLVGNGLPFFVGNDASGEDPFDCADLWIAPGVSLLTDGDITVADRRKFISALGKPVNPSGFPSGAVLFTGTASTFGTNQGTGGAFTLTGSLTDASTSPSD